MTGARQIIAMMIAFKKSNKNSLKRRSFAYRSNCRINTLYK